MKRSVAAVRDVNYDISLLKAIDKEGSRINRLVDVMDGNVDLDQIWVSMSKRHFQAAIDCARRSVNKKDNF